MIPYFDRDWQTPDDYDPDDAEWIDATTIGSSYEHQVDARSSRHRHRRTDSMGAWVQGPPPKQMPKIYNKHNGGYPKDAVYVGRGEPIR